MSTQAGVAPPIEPPCLDRQLEFDDDVDDRRQLRLGVTGLAGGTNTYKQLARRAEADVGAAREALEKTLALRSVLRSIFGSLAAGIAPDQEAISGLNRFVREAQGHMHLVGSEAEYDWEWLADEDLGRVLWPVAPLGGGTPCLGAAVQGPDVRRRHLPLALRRHQQERQTALVRHESLWQPCQGPASLRPDAIGSC